MSSEGLFGFRFFGLIAPCGSDILNNRFSEHCGVHNQRVEMKLVESKNHRDRGKTITLLVRKWKEKTTEL